MKSNQWKNSNILNHSLHLINTFCGIFILEFGNKRSILLKSLAEIIKLSTHNLFLHYLWLSEPKFHSDLPQSQDNIHIHIRILFHRMVYMYHHSGRDLDHRGLLAPLKYISIHEEQYLYMYIHTNSKVIPFKNSTLIYRTVSWRFFSSRHNKFR